MNKSAIQNCFYSKASIVDSLLNQLYLTDDDYILLIQTLSYMQGLLFGSSDLILINKLYEYIDKADKYLLI